MTFEFRPESVSSHAVTRYVQRILRLRVVDISSATTERSVAELHAAAAGLTVLEIKKRLYTPATAAAIALGAGDVCVGDMQVVFIHGRIVTVLPRQQPRPIKGRIRILSDKESRRAMQRRGRRRRAANRTHDDEGG